MYDNVDWLSVVEVPAETRLAWVDNVCDRCQPSFVLYSYRACVPFTFLSASSTGAHFKTALLSSVIVLGYRSSAYG